MFSTVVYLAISITMSFSCVGIVLFGSVMLAPGMLPVSVDKQMNHNLNSHGLPEGNIVCESQRLVNILPSGNSKFIHYSINIYLQCVWHYA